MITNDKIAQFLYLTFEFYMSSFYSWDMEN